MVNREACDVPSSLTFTISWRYLSQAAKRGAISRESRSELVLAPVTDLHEAGWEMVVPKLAFRPRPPGTKALAHPAPAFGSLQRGHGVLVAVVLAAAAALILFLWSLR